MSAAGRRPPLTYTKPRDWTERYFTRGPAGEYMTRLRVRPADRFIIICRVSRRQQNKKRKLDYQEAKLRRYIEARGGIVIAVVREVKSGWEPKWLWQHAKTAEHQGAKLVALTPDRFVRNHHYQSSDKRLAQLQATTDELAELRFWTRGVELMTYIDPDATPGKCRSILTKIGKAASTKRDGRPPKQAIDREPGYRARRKAKGIERMMEMYGKGCRIRGIAKRLSRQLGVTPKTVYKWMREAGITPRGGIL